MRIGLFKDAGMKTLTEIVEQDLDVGFVRITSGHQVPVERREAQAIFNFYKIAEQQDKSVIDQMPLIPLLAMFYSALIGTRFDSLQKTKPDLKKTTFH